MSEEAQNQAMVAGPTAKERKAAILVLTLGDELAGELFSRMSEKDIRSLVKAASYLDRVTNQEITDVLQEFKMMFTSGAPVPRPGELMPMNIAEGAFRQIGAAGEFQDLVSRTLGDQRAQYLIASSMVTEDPFKICRTVDPQTLASVLSTENPQTIAVVMSALEPDRAGAVMENFPPELSAQVVYRMAHMRNVSDEVRSEIGNTLTLQLQEMGSSQGIGPMSVEEHAVEIVTAMSQEQSDRMFSSLEMTDPDFAAEIRSKMFVFEDLAKFDTRSMQRLLRDVDSKQLVIALKNASTAVKELIFSSMSSRAAEMLREDLELSKPVRIKEVEDAQAAIIDIAYRLDAEGALVIPKGGGSELV